jgi:hypothetical protein
MMQALEGNGDNYVILRDWALHIKPWVRRRRRWMP